MNLQCGYSVIIKRKNISLAIMCITTFFVFIFAGQETSYGGPNEVNNFVNNIVPKLMSFAESENIKFLEGENKKDFMTCLCI